MYNSTVVKSLILQLKSFPTSCITFTANEPELRQHTKVPALNLTQDLYVSDPLPQTARIMAKDEDVCLHCGLCAERCPTAAWDMQKFFYNVTKAGEGKYGCNKSAQLYGSCSLKVVYGKNFKTAGNFER